MEAELKRERRRRQRQQVFNCCKKTIAFLFSHIGLCGLVVAYSIMGGFLFKALEGPAEVRDKMTIINQKEGAVARVWELAVLVKAGQLDQGNFTTHIHGLLVEFQKNITAAVKEKGWDGNDELEEIQWSFAGALLYAVTVITTIGYGHVAPKTIWGRLVTILYALVGIPLTFLYLSNIGNFLADCFRLIYKKVCCDILCCQKCERQRKRERLLRKRQKDREAKQALALVETKLFTEDETRGEFYGLPGGQGLDDLGVKVDIQRDSGENNACFEGCDSDRELPQSVIDNMDFARETAILDDNISSDDVKASDSTKPRSDKPENGSRGESFSSANTEILSKLPAARETDILSDSEDEGVDNPGLTLSDEATPREKQALQERATTNTPKRKSFFRRFTAKKEKDRKKDLDIELGNSNCDNDVHSSGNNVTNKTHECDKKSRNSKREKSPSKKKSTKMSKKEKNKSKKEVTVDASDTDDMDSKSDLKKSKKKGKRKDLDRSRHMSLRALKAKSKERKELEGLALESPQLSRRSLHSSGESARRRADSEESFTTAHSSFPGLSRQASELEGSALLGARVLDDDAASDPGASEAHSHGALGRCSSLPADIGVLDEGAALTIVEQPLNVEYVDLNSFQPDAAGLGFDDQFIVEEDSGKVTVPITVCLIIIAAYIFLGSILFAYWEGWDYLTGSYFCFVTLSTIGFGDIVPGMGMDDWESHQKLVLCSLYLAFGLSLLAMCFNLMQEEVKEKCKWVARKLGLIKDDES